MDTVCVSNEHYYIEIKENEQGIIVDVYDANGDNLLQTDTWWNMDEEATDD